MSEPKSFHMSPEEFRRHGHAVVDWIADYHSRIESFPVLSRAQPGEIRSKLPPGAPEQGEAFDQILSDIERVILPGITHWQSPNFYAYFPANASGRPFSAICFPPDWACKACSGPRVRRPPNLKRTCLIGWCRCWACRRNFYHPAAAAAEVE